MCDLGLPCGLASCPWTRPIPNESSVVGLTVPADLPVSAEDQKRVEGLIDRARLFVDDDELRIADFKPDYWY